MPKIIKNLTTILNKHFPFETGGSPKEICVLSQVGYLLGEELYFIASQSPGGSPDP